MLQISSLKDHNDSLLDSDNFPSCTIPSLLLSEQLLTIKSDLLSLLDACGRKMWHSGDRSWAVDSQGDLYEPKFQEKWFERLLEASDEYSAEAFFIREQDRLVYFVSSYIYQDLNEQEIQYSSYKNGTSSVWIQMIAVDPVYQGRGFGATALELVESLSRSKGAEHIRLMTQSSNKAAQGFYSRLGYRYCGNDALRNPSRYCYNVFLEKSLV